MPLLHNLTEQCLECDICYVLNLKVHHVVHLQVANSGTWLRCGIRCKTQECHSFLIENGSFRPLHQGFI
jgi:hypothetical protein